MPLAHVPGSLETERLILRPRDVADAPVLRQLWTERADRVPPHRRIDSEGRPTVDDIAARIRAEDSVSGLLVVVRKGTADVIGYCGVSLHGSGSPDEPELAFELLRAVHGNGYATEAAEAVITWARDAGYSRLRAEVWDWNLASRRVLRKLGFRETGRVGTGSAHGHSLTTIRDLGV